MAEIDAGAEDRKQGRRKRSYLVSVDAGTTAYLAKVNDYTGLPWWRRLGRSKARRDLDRAGAIAARGIPTPLPVVAGELRRGPLLERCYELVPWLADAIDLRRAREEGTGTPAERRLCAQALGTCVRRMHEAGIDQRDLAPNNFLWRPAARPSLLAIDFERVRLAAAVPSPARIAALAKLDRHCAGASASARMRFLRAYCAGDRAAARTLWRTIEEASAALLRHDAARWERVATRRGRRFQPVTISIGATRWQGWSRRALPADVLRRALEQPGSPGAALLLRVVEPGTARGAARAWAMALTLHQRAVSPQPVAALHARGRAWLAFEATPVPFDPLEGANARSALVVLLDRLLSWGGVAATLPVDAIAREGPRCVLLDPAALRTDLPRVGTDRRSVARRRADQLLATPTRDGRVGRDESRP